MPLISFSDYLRSKSVDERTLTAAQHAVEFARFQTDTAPPLVAVDGSGQEVQIGDMVTLTLKVTGIHPETKPANVDGKAVEIRVLQLSRVVEGAPEPRNLLNCDATWTKKV